VYCKECIAKIKSGEVKVEKGSENQIRYDDSKFFKPLADLGIEFAPKENKVHEEKERYPERVEHKQQIVSKQQPIQTSKPYVAPHKPGIMDTVKKVFHIQPSVSHKAENSALKDVLSKALENTEKEKTPAPISSSTPSNSSGQAAPISLDALKDKMRDVKKESIPSKDRAATSEEMNRLKDLIAQKTPTSPSASSGSTAAPQKPTPPEVPEDVLRKILE
jgi:hypothetical protein